MNMKKSRQVGKNKPPPCAYETKQTCERSKSAFFASLPPKEYITQQYRRWNHITSQKATRRALTYTHDISPEADHQTTQNCAGNSPPNSSSCPAAAFLALALASLDVAVLILLHSLPCPLEALLPCVSRACIIVVVGVHDNQPRSCVSVQYPAAAAIACTCCTAGCLPCQSGCYSKKSSKNIMTRYFPIY